MKRNNDFKSNIEGKKREGKRLNWWWVYMVILVLFLLPPITGVYSPEKITWQRFEKDMISRKAVEKLTVINNENVEVYIKKEFARDKLFKNAFKPPFGSGLNNGPHYTFIIGSVDSFERY